MLKYQTAARHGALGLCELAAIYGRDAKTALDQ
jgi:hypothetical protein